MEYTLLSFVITQTVSIILCIVFLVLMLRNCNVKYMVLICNYIKQFPLFSVLVFLVLLLRNCHVEYTSLSFVII